jgi:hypothetical protein
MKKILVTLFIIFISILSNQRLFSQGNWWTGRGYLRPGVASVCGCGYAFEMDSSYRPFPIYRYIWLLDGPIQYDFKKYQNIHCEVSGLGTVCVEACGALELFSIKVILQGHIRTDVPSSCMCGTAFELDPEYQAAPENKYIFLKGDWTAYIKLRIEVKGQPDSCTEGCTVIEVDEVKILPTVSAEDFPISIPSSSILNQNFPNPFNPTTTITYDITQHSFVQLCVYDLLGKQISTLVDEEKKPGRYETTWDASDFPSGIYFYRLNVGNNLLSGKMSLVK